MAPKQLNIENLYLFRAKFIMSYLGVWIPPDNESVTHRVYRYIMMSLQYLFLLFQTIYMIQVWGDLEAISQALYLLFTQACLCLKVTVFQVQIGNLKKLLLKTHGDIFKPQNLKHEQILKAQASRIKRLMLFFMISSQTCCLLWALKPLFDDVGSRKFPFDMWMPVRPDQSPHFHIGYICQLAVICMSAFMYFGVDSVAFSMIIYGCAQIEIVKDKLLSIGVADHNKLLDKEKKKINDANYKKLVECSVHHQEIVTFAKITENAYHLYLLFQLTGSVGIICISALRIIIIDWKSMQFLSMIAYLSLMIIHLFICCWCGHELTATSENYHRVLYECMWYEQDLRFKRSLLFMMMRANRPMVLKAGHYITLSRQTFVSILRMSYSYFAVLNQTAK